MFSICLRFTPCCSQWHAERLDILSGFVKTLKHSSIPFLQVIEGSKSIFWSLSWVVSFLAFQSEVSDSVSWGSNAKGFIWGQYRSDRLWPQENRYAGFCNLLVYL